MKKAQQQDILNIIETMGQAHEEVRQALEPAKLRLKKIENVFKIFKKNQDEVVLLWRPQLWEAYKEIRDRYIEEGWGSEQCAAGV